MLLAVFLAVFAAAALDLRRSCRSAREAPCFRASSWFFATLVAAALPLGAVLPGGSLSHVGSVPSFDLLRPCVAPSDAPAWHALVPFAGLRVLLPLALVALFFRERPAPRPRLLLGLGVALSTTVLVLFSARALRGGAELASYRTCGALTPEDGSDAARVRRLLGHSKQELIHWRALPRLPRPPWVRGEIAVTIAGEPWVLRSRGAAVVAEPDDPRRADRPLPALHFASVPSMASSSGSMVLLDHRPEGKLYAVRVGRPARFVEIAPLLRPPRWPIAPLLLAIGATLGVSWASRPRRLLAGFAPYRAPPVANPTTTNALSAFCGFLLIEASLTAMHVLLPYL